VSELLTLAVIGLGLSSAWRFLRGLRRRSSLIAGEEQALQYLEQRYARGEIGPREYEAGREALLRR